MPTLIIDRISIDYSYQIPEDSPFAFEFCVQHGDNKVQKSMEPNPRYKVGNIIELDLHVTNIEIGAIIEWRVKGQYNLHSDGEFKATPNGWATYPTRGYGTSLYWHMAGVL
ncbi:protein of unknown function [Tepidibacter aestuarii]|nr:protein of unknown function [Tepidibacter aestuarii]